MIHEKPVRIGVVGAGHRGGTFVAELRHIPQGKLTALCDTNAGRMDIFNNRWKLDGVLRTTNLDEMLKGDLVDAIIVAVPDKFHREVAVKALQAGKDILLEKPLAPTADDCRAIIDAYKKSGRLMQVGFVLRSTKFYQKIKEIVDSGKLGQIMFIRACEYLGVEHGASYMTRWHRKKENAGTFLLAKCSHDLDLLNWIIGSRPTHVAS
ncbi:MAG: gfo/Idh/MocA family oxidoreductase, partial [Planctomycetaceae bacterium]